MQQEERRLDQECRGPSEVPHEVVCDDVGDGAGHEAAVERVRKFGIPRRYLRTRRQECHLWEVEI